MFFKSEEEREGERLRRLNGSIRGEHQRNHGSKDKECRGLTGSRIGFKWEIRKGEFGDMKITSVNELYSFRMTRKNDRFF